MGMKIMSPLVTDGFEHNEHEDDEDSASIASTAASTPTSEYSVNADTVVKTLADRLSFWNRMSRRSSRSTSVTSSGNPTTVESELSEPPEEAAKRVPLLSIDSIMEQGSSEPGEVLDTILASAAPPPPTAAEKNSQIQEKIVRDCIREFTRGGMYFAYTFGMAAPSCIFTHCID